jgi:hypothetical protein
MQTLAGLALDVKHHDSQGEYPSSSSLVAIQHLLNIFVCLNIFQFLMLIALGYLYRRREAVAAVAGTYGSPGETMLEEFDEDQESSPKSANYSDHTAGVDDSIYLRRMSREGHMSSVIFPKPHPKSKTKQVKRGELFAGLSVALVVLAWTLFLVTAWMKLRSKVERGAAEVP